MSLIYCAVDTPDLKRAKELAQMMARAGCGVKLGLEFFAHHGGAGVAAIRDSVPDVSLFLDLKFHDIPNTVAGALRGVARLGVSYVNVHASGGRLMMEAARESLNDEAVKSGVYPPKLLAVTVLTSLDDDALRDVGQSVPAADQVLRLAGLTRSCGLAGVVCSAAEISVLRGALGPDFVLMVPGIRPAGSTVGDQKRVMTPEEAIRLGATHLVIGRPITGSPDPEATARDILLSLNHSAV